MEVGDLVLLTNNKTNKQSPNYNPSPCEVIDRYRGDVSIRKKDGVETKRNMSLFFLRSTRRMVLQNQNQNQNQNQWHHFSQLLAQFQCSRQLTHLCLKQAWDQLKLHVLDFLNDLVIMNCQGHDWTLLVADRLTAVPCLTCYETELNFFLQYLTFHSRFILDIPLCSKKIGRMFCNKPDV